MYYSGDDDDMFECETCPKQFYSRHAVNQHMDATEHWSPTFECDTCNKRFRSRHAANQHMTSVGHWSSHTNECDTRTNSEYYCQPCQRQFQSQNNLNMHLRSKAHIGSNGVPCPFCKQGFVTASGLAHHLERGSCSEASWMNRETVLHMVRQLDPQGKITMKQIGWRDESNNQSQYYATDKAYNGQYWECYLCQSQFRTSQSLNSHLNSPVHKQKVYHCPNMRGCAREFVTLAALFNHLESESCAAMRFDAVQRGVTGMMTGRMLIGM